MKPFNLSNKKKVDLYLKSIVVLVIANMFSLFIVFFIEYIPILKYTSLAILLVLFIIFWNIKYFEYDFSGEVICVKSYHPLFGQRQRHLEFPKDKIHDFRITKTNNGTKLKLSVKFRDRPTQSYYRIYWLRDLEVQKIKTSLDEIIKTVS